MIVPEHRIAISVATNVSGSENTSLLTAQLADIFIRYLDGAARNRNRSNM